MKRALTFVIFFCCNYNFLVGGRIHFQSRRNIGTSGGDLRLPASRHTETRPLSGTKIKISDGKPKSQVKGTPPRLCGTIPFLSQVPSRPISR